MEGMELLQDDAAKRVSIHEIDWIIWKNPIPLRPSSLEYRPIRRQIIFKVRGQPWRLLITRYSASSIQWHPPASSLGRCFRHARCYPAPPTLRGLLLLHYLGFGIYLTRNSMLYMSRDFRRSITRHNA